MNSFSSSALLRSLISICGLSYMLAVVIGDLQFDSFSDSQITKFFYCSLHRGVRSNPLRLLPLFSVVILTFVSMIATIYKSYQTNQLLLARLSICGMLILFGWPLTIKCVILQSNACDEASGGDWENHRSILQLHTAIAMILFSAIISEIYLISFKFKIK
jgi:hypothetical protein